MLAFVFLSFLTHQTYAQAVDNTLPVVQPQCGLLVADAFSPVILEKQAECYITIDREHSSYFPESLTIVDDFGSKYQAVFYKADEYFHVKNLPQGRSFSVVYPDECGNKALLGSFKTHYESGRLIRVSKNLYNLISDISINRKGNTNTMREILADKSVHDFEKASFFQRYFLKGKTVKNIEELYDESVVMNKSMMSCNCEQVIHQWWLNPGQLNFNNGGVLEENPRFETDDNKLEFQLHTSGAAKAWRAYSDGWREQRNEPYGGAVGSNGATVTDLTAQGDLPNDFTLESRIGMNLFCNAGVTPADCGCDKVARSRIFYESQLGVRSQIGSGGGEKNSFAAGEDIALAYQLRRDGTASGEFTFLGGFVNTARDSCGQMPNSEFWSSAASATFGIATLAASFIVEDTTSSLFSQTRLQLISQIGSDLGDVITTSATTNAGECSTQLQVQVAPSRLDLQPDVTLTPNIPTEIGIATRARLVSMGMRSWQSEVTLASGFSLATVHPAGLASSDEDPGCCLDRTEVTYISRAFDSGVPFVNQIPPVSPQIDLQVDAASFIRTWANTTFDFLTDNLGRYYTRYEFGDALASARYDEGKCQLEPGTGGVDGPGPGAEGNLRGPDEITNGKAFVDFDPSKLEPVEYSFYSIDGKIIGKRPAGNVLSEVNLRDYLNTLNMPAGIYLVHGIQKSGRSPKIRKIHLNR